MQLYLWGENLSGQAGAQVTLSPVSWSVPGSITSICGGDRHALFLTADGDVLSCGNNAQAQLGRNNKNGNKPRRVEGLGKVVSMACGEDHCLAVCASGEMFSWGAWEDGQLGVPPAESAVDTHRPRHVPLPPPMRVVQVSCGKSHSLALSAGGDVFSWGLNSHGQLGLSKDVPRQPNPHLVVALSGVAVTQVSAGGSHSLFLSLPGLVYCCGANRSGQLGLNRVDEKGRFNICMVPALRPLGVSFISCGESHSAVLTKDGEVFTFGEGVHGQLGHSCPTDELMPRRVEGLDGTACQLACGRRHTLVLGSSGQLWAFGDGSRGQMGSGQADGSLTPAVVQLPWVTDGAAAPTDLNISAGWNTNFAYSSPAQNLDCRRTIGRLDDAKVQKWLKLKLGNQETKREIAEMFQTSSSLVACFTKPDGPPLGAGALTVDLEAASRVFDQLLEKPWIRQSVDLKLLLELLVISRTALKSPEVLLLLLSWPLLQEDANVIHGVLPLAYVVSSLHEKTRATLKSWWSSLPVPMLMKHIMVFKKALVFMLRNSLLTTHNPGVRYLLESLKLLYKANKTGKSHKVPLNTFYVEEINTAVQPYGDFVLWRTFAQQEDNEDTPAIFCRYSFLFTLVAKVAMFNINASVRKNVHLAMHELAVNRPDLAQMNPTDSAPAPAFQLTLRRTHLVEDTFRQLDAADHSAFQRELWVQFVDDRKLMNVNKRDLFLHVFDELTAPESEMFMYNDSNTLAWFPPKPKVEEKQYFLFGILCGLALYNHNMIHLPFPRALFKKLLRVQPTLDDMKEFEPVIAESCHCILDYAPDVVQTLETTFTVSWGGEEVELDPKDPKKLVTGSNRKEFVAAYVDFAFNKSVARVFEAFKRGFFKVCDMDVVDFFQPEELQEVMVGHETYDWEVFKQNTVYDGEYHAEHPNIVIFWEVFDNLTEKDKKKFLLFLTGCDRVPFLGMESVRMTIAVLLEATELHLPESLTCHLLLLLPMYSRYPVERTMQSRLLQAINHNRGFWK